METRIIAIAQTAREVLLKEFPDSPNMEKQCKRAAILIDMALKRIGAKSHIESGNIVPFGGKRSADNGHVWNVVSIGKKKFLLDASLTQFSALLGVSVPEIVWGEQKETEKAFRYKSDLLGKYPHRAGDVRESLIQAMLERADIGIAKTR